MQQLDELLGGSEEGRLTLVSPAGDRTAFMAASAAGRTIRGPVLLLGRDPAHLKGALAVWKLHDPRPQVTFSERYDQPAAAAQDAPDTVCRPRPLAGWIAQHANGLVAAPFSRLVLALIAEAHRKHALPAWGLIVVDEAHLVAGEPVSGQMPDAAVHFDDLIPGKRIYLTATPRIEPTLAPCAAQAPLVAMDRYPLFGPIARDTTRAGLVRSGALSPYRIELIEISYRPPPARPKGEPYARLQAASHIAADSIRRNQLQRILSVHASKRHALDFAANMAARMGEDIRITAPGGNAGFATSGKPTLRCTTWGKPVTGSFDALILADPRLDVLAAVDVLGTVLGQHPADVAQLTFILPVPRPPEQEHLARSAAGAYEPIDRFLAALHAHDPDYAQNFREDLVQPGSLIVDGPATRTGARTTPAPQRAGVPAGADGPSAPAPLPCAPACGTPDCEAVPDLWSGIHATVTHTGLRIPNTVGVEQAGKQITITSDAVRTVMVLLSGHDQAALDRVESVFDWLPWEAPEIPDMEHAWKVVFHRRDRTFEGLYNEALGSTHPILQVPMPVSIDDAMWQMLEDTVSVVLCTGLIGDPDVREISTAAQRRLIRAGLAEAVFR